MEPAAVPETSAESVAVSGLVPFGGTDESDTVRVGVTQVFNVQDKLHALGQLPFPDGSSHSSVPSRMPLLQTAGGAATFTITESFAEPPGPVHEMV